MPQHTIKPWSTQQCQQSCNNQRNTCLNLNTDTPDPASAYTLQRCHTNYRNCSKSCTTNNIRPSRKN